MNDEDETEIGNGDLAYVRKIAKDLLKHFDAVQVFATRQEGNKTINVTAGLGNWYANFGQVSLWLECQKVQDVRDNVEK
jgi:hypothetical protein